jgi:hypothetical protein
VTRNGVRSVWYRWVAPAAGQATFDTCTHSYDTVLAAYTGSAVNGLTPVASNDDTTGCGGDDHGSRIQFTATAGTTYRVAVDGFNGAVGTFTLTFSGPSLPPPSNDNMGSARVVSGGSFDVTGTNRGATKQTGEPNHAGNAGGASVWFRWTAPSTRFFTIRTAGSNFDTLLGIYRGARVNNLTRVASNDDASSSTLTSRVRFRATAGVTYRIAVDGYRGSTGPAKTGGIRLRTAPS